MIFCLIESSSLIVYFSISESFTLVLLTNISTFYGVLINKNNIDNPNSTKPVTQKNVDLDTSFNIKLE